MISYYRHLAYFLTRDALPQNRDELTPWAMTLPYKLWDRVCRYEGKTFAEYYLGDLDALALRRFFGSRSSYAALLVLWPAAAAFMAARHGRHALPQLRRGLARPDLRLYFPERWFSQQEAETMRPDLLAGMYYAFEYTRSQPDYLTLDNKRLFAELCREQELPVPTEYTVDQARQLSEPVMVKDPQQDLGRGVFVRSPNELDELDPGVDWIIQERLRNHSDLAALLPPDAALSTARVITLVPRVGDPPQVSHFFLRLPRAGAVVDNFAAGGMVSRVDRATGMLTPAVTKQWPQPGSHFESHPDSGVLIKGAIAPLHCDVQALCIDAHQRLAPDAPSIGWDVAMTPNGLRLLELNFFAASFQWEETEDAYAPLAEAILDRLHYGER
ncbi:MAG: hypothetical protein MJE77_35125 [Proteobacteria bacterium]|nr:hypothetical protein [Pseudomonadota bacterium]